MKVKQIKVLNFLIAFYVCVYVRVCVTTVCVSTFESVSEDSLPPLISC